MAARVAGNKSAVTVSSASSSSSSSLSQQEQMAAKMSMMADQLKQMKDQVANQAQAHAKRQKSDLKSEAIYFDLTVSSDAKVGKKRVCVQTWKNRVHIHIREYYKDKVGGWKPTKKGIALKPEEFRTLVSCAPQITQAVEDRS